MYICTRIISHIHVMYVYACRYIHISTYVYKGLYILYICIYIYLFCYFLTFLFFLSFCIIKLLYIKYVKIYMYGCIYNYSKDKTIFLVPIWFQYTFLIKPLVFHFSNIFSFCSSKNICLIFYFFVFFHKNLQ